MRQLWHPVLSIPQGTCQSSRLRTVVRPISSEETVDKASPNEHEIKVYIRGVFEEFETSLPESYSGSIHHYTNVAGLEGIVQSRTLWLADVMCMSDWLELTYAFESTKRHIIDAFESSVDALCKEFLRPIIKRYEELFSLFGYYCSCFSVDGDKLSQWRAYADDGRGYALEFVAPKPTNFQS